MSLIRTEEIKSPAAVHLPIASIKADECFITGEAVEVIRKLIDLCFEREHVHFISSGTFSLHQLISGIIKRMISPAEVRICTWAISEDPMRSLADLKYSGKISRLEFLFDEKLSQRQSKPFQLATGIADKIVLQKCHAKIVVIKSPERSFVINGSMNWTRNPRIESGFVSSADKTVEFYDHFLSEVK